MDAAALFSPPVNMEPAIMSAQRSAPAKKMTIHRSGLCLDEVDEAGRIALARLSQRRMNEQLKEKNSLEAAERTRIKIGGRQADTL